MCASSSIGYIALINACGEVSENKKRLFISRYTTRFKRIYYYWSFTSVWSSFCRSFTGPSPSCDNLISPLASSFLSLGLLFFHLFLSFFLFPFAFSNGIAKNTIIIDLWPNINFKPLLDVTGNAYSESPATLERSNLRNRSPPRTSSSSQSLAPWHLHTVHTTNGQSKSLLCRDGIIATIRYDSSFRIIRNRSGSSLGTFLT